MSWQHMVRAVLPLALVSVALPASATVCSLKEFHAMQAAYCKDLVEYRNQPVDWHILLDTSDTYASSAERISETISDILPVLPIQERDEVELAFFSDDREPIPSGIARHLLTNMAVYRPKAFAKHVAMYLPERLDRGDPSRTDLEALVSRIAGLTHAACGEGMRPVIIVVSDGRHDPENSNGFIELFGPGGEFGAQLKEITARNRLSGAHGLWFLVDTRGLESGRLRRLIESDWRRGQLLLADAMETAAHRLSIIQWDVPLKVEKLGRDLSSFLMRNTGADACFPVKPNVMTRFVQSENPGDCTGPPFHVALPWGVGAFRQSAFDVKLGFLARGDSRPEVDVELSDAEGTLLDASLSPKRVPGNRDRSRADRESWYVYYEKFSIDLNDRRRELTQAPWRLSVDFLDTKHHLATIVPSSNHPRWAKLFNKVARRGRLGWLGALVLFFLALWAPFTRQKELKVFLKLPGESVFSPLKGEERARHLGRRTKVRIREVMMGGGGELDWEFIKRSARPTRGISFDVIYFVNMIFVVYFCRANQRLQAAENVEEFEIESAPPKPELMDGVLFVSREAEQFWRKCSRDEVREERIVYFHDRDPVVGSGSEHAPHNADEESHRQEEGPGGLPPEEAVTEEEREFSLWRETFTIPSLDSRLSRLDEAKANGADPEGDRASASLDPDDYDIAVLQGPRKSFGVLTRELCWWAVWSLAVGAFWNARELSDTGPLGPGFGSCAPYLMAGFAGLPFVWIRWWAWNKGRARLTRRLTDGLHLFPMAVLLAASIAVWFPLVDEALFGLILGLGLAALIMSLGGRGWRTYLLLRRVREAREPTAMDFFWDFVFGRFGQVR